MRFCCDELADLLGLWDRSPVGDASSNATGAAAGGHRGLGLVGIERIERRLRRAVLDAGREVAVGDQRVAADDGRHRLAVETPGDGLAEVEVRAERILVHAEPDRLDFRRGDRDQLHVGIAVDQRALVGNDAVDDIGLPGEQRAEARLGILDELPGQRLELGGAALVVVEACRASSRSARRRSA